MTPKLKAATEMLRETVAQFSADEASLVAVDAAFKRFRDIARVESRPKKNWFECPYEVHADDCDCRGSVGDR